MSFNIKVDHITLVVDLDGTFLERVKNKPDPLYKLISKNRDKFTLIFATGRALESITPLFADASIPRPDFIVGDVGATLTDGATLTSITELQSPIDTYWPGTNRILESLSSYDGLRLQNVPQSRRCSFFVDLNQIDIPKIENHITALNCELVISDNQYLDVLPKGVSKGNSVKNLLKLKGLHTSAVLCAGDTLNDLSLFSIGFNAVAVGGSEPELINQVKKIKMSYASSLQGTQGILDALLKFKYIDRSLDSINKIPLKSDSSSLVMVYHRQPFDEIRRGKEVLRKLPESPNGIIPTLLGFFSGESKGSWVAWSQHNNINEPFESHVSVDPKLYPGLVAARVPLSSEDVNLFYKRFSKEAFWPIIFSFPDRVQIDHSHWEHFKKINRLFAEQAAQEAAFEALVWIHDYNLWLVPGYLRQLRPDVKIAFFHHTSFPTPDIFNILPWRRDIIGSLVQCDYIGFHIPRYVENFVDVVRSTFQVKINRRTDSSPQFLTYDYALGVDSYASEVTVNNHHIRLGAHPVGIELERVRDSFIKPKVQKAYHDLLSELQNRKVILSVERLDYVKGPIEKLNAFEKLLESYPELHEKIVFINIVTPPAPGMDIYKQTRERLDQAVGRINGRFAKVNWTPIRYFYKSFPFDDLIAFYATADIAWITPLRDGLNLVCKEYVATKEVAQSIGTLVLSEFAGASVELHGALLTNPFDLRNMVDVLYRAINLDSQEQQVRFKQMINIITKNSVSNWSKEFVRAFANEQYYHPEH